MNRKAANLSILQLTATTVNCPAHIIAGDLPFDN